MFYLRKKLLLQKLSLKRVMIQLQGDVDAKPKVFIEELMSGLWQIEPFRCHYQENQFSGETMVEFWRGIVWPSAKLWSKKYSGEKLDELMRENPNIRKVDPKVIQSFKALESRHKDSSEWKPTPVLGVIQNRFVPVMLNTINIQGVPKVLGILFSNRSSEILITHAQLAFSATKDFRSESSIV